MPKWNIEDSEDDLLAVLGPRAWRSIATSRAADH
jgi:hypothetical protein